MPEVIVLRPPISIKTLQRNLSHIFHQLRCTVMPSEAQEAMLIEWAKDHQHLNPITPPPPRPPPPYRSPYWLLVGLLVGIAIGILLCQRHVAVHYSSEADCLRILSSIQSLKNFPLPHSIDYNAHGILNERSHQESFKSLSSDVKSALANTTQKHVRLIKKATQIYTRASSEYKNNEFRRDIQIAREHISRAEARIGDLADRYGTVRDDYYAIDQITEKALQDGQLSDSEEWWVCQRPPLLPLIGGFDANREYLEPFEEKSRRRKEARLAVIAWERETQRLEQILQVIREGDWILEDLANSLTQWETTRPSSTSSWGQFWRSALQSLDPLIIESEDTRDSRQRWLREWFGQLIKNERAKKSWKQLSTLLESPEQIPLEISIDWCEP